MRVNTMIRSGGRLAPVAVLALLAGCAVKPVPVVLEAPLPEAPLNIAAPILPRPQPPAGMAATFVPPPRLPGGGYMTINTNIGPDETLWHLRSALNVAALSCTGPDQAALVADYNGIITEKKAALLVAYTKTRANLKKSFGSGWETQFDQDNTRIYNFFSQIQPDAHQEFCLAAIPIAKEMRTVEGTGLNTYAAAVMPRLEKPFLEMYAAFDRYRADLADWMTRYGGVTDAGTAVAGNSGSPQTVPLPASIPATAQASGAGAPAASVADTPIAPAGGTAVVGPPSPPPATAPQPNAAPTLPYAPVSDPTVTH